MPQITIAGLNVDAITKSEFLSQTQSRVLSGKKTFVITPYSEFLYQALRDPRLLEIFNAADFSLADGIGIFWAKKFLDLPLSAQSYWGKIVEALWQIFYTLGAIIFYPRWIKKVLPEKIVGADLIWDLAKLAESSNFSIFLLGGYGNTAKLVANKLKLKFPKLKIAGTSNQNPDDPSIITEINSAAPDILLVAYGPVKQEQWIHNNFKNISAKFAIGLGGSFDYIAGEKSAPPAFIRYSGLEWLWRLITQPQRLKRIFQATFGLINCLWHYKVFLNLPYRENVAVVIINKQGKILICKRNPHQNNETITAKELRNSDDYWQLPRGGIDPGEEIAGGGLKEAFEETGLTKLDLIKISERQHFYSWNNAIRKFTKKNIHRNIGQRQSIAYLKHTGDDSDVRIDNHEFVGYKWVSVNELAPAIHAERNGLTNMVVEDLKEILQNANI